MVDLNEARLTYRRACGSRVDVDVTGARRLVAAWSGTQAGTVKLRASFDAGADEEFVLWDEARGSVSRAAGRATLAVDELRSIRPLTRASITATGKLAVITIATSARAHGDERVRATQPLAGHHVELDVEPRSQYETDARGWCAPTSLAMLLAYAGISLDTAEVAEAVFDRALGGTGNWSRCAGYASRFGFGTVAYLRDLAHARNFVTAGFPLALSFAWLAGDLPGAPLEESTGHLAVLRGFDRGGNPSFADPAQPSRIAVYDYGAFERAWLRHGGVALVAARERDANALLALAGPT